MDGMMPSSFGEWLKTFRKRRKLTQQTLAQRVGVHRNTIGSWELGTFLPESRTIVLEVARQLQLNPEETRCLLEASLTGLSPYWSVPYQRNPFFQGRDEILQQIHQVVTAHSSYRSVALTGLGGIGKTQTAVEFAYRYAYHYSAILWLNAHSLDACFSSMVAIAEVLNLPEAYEQDHHRISTAVLRWLKGHTQWLLILDNFEDLEQFQELMSTSREGTFIFTSQRHAFSHAALTVALPPLTQDESVELLLHRARRITPQPLADPPSEEDRLWAGKIAVSMQCLPLALDQAGAYIEATSCTLADYYHLLSAAQAPLLSAREATDAHPLSVARTFLLAFARLAHANRLAIDLLHVCAFLAPEAIPDQLFVEGAAALGGTLKCLGEDRLALLEVLKALLAYSLIQRNASAHTITVHRLVQAVLREHQSQPEQLAHVGQVLHVMTQVFPAHEMQKDYWTTGERYLAHALACLAWCERYEVDRAMQATLMIHVAMYLSNRARYDEAKRLFESAKEMLERTCPSAGALIADALYGLAILHMDQDQWSDAEALHHQALLMRERVYGLNDEVVAISLNMLAECLRKQGRLMDAEPMYLRALRIREQGDTLALPSGAALLNNLALLFLRQRRYTEAEPLLLRARQIWEETLGSEHPQVAYALNNLAMLYAEQGAYTMAEPLFELALCIREKALGSDHPQMIYPVGNLAELYSLEGKYAQAEPLFQRAMAICDQVFGPDHPQSVYSLTGLADLCAAQGRDEEALHLYERSLMIRKRHLSPLHPDIADSLVSLARFYQTHERSGDAIPLYQQALAICEQLFGQEHPKVQEIRELYNVVAAIVADQ